MTIEHTAICVTKAGKMGTDVGTVVVLLLLVAAIPSGNSVVLVNIFLLLLQIQLLLMEGGLSI